MRRKSSKPVPGRIGVVGVIASAGGLGAITAILRDLPGDFPVPVVVFQHLSTGFSHLAQRLARATKLPTSWAVDGERIVPGEVKVCPAGMRMEVMPDGSIDVCPGEPGWRDRPLDLFLGSLAESFGPRALAIVLTGMGSDGSVGARKIKDAGGTVLVQDEETAEAPSMPKAAVQNGAADLVLPLNEIGKIIREFATGGRLPRPKSEREAAERLFADPGEVSAIARKMDWSATQPGPVTGWPMELRLMVRASLDNHSYPMAVWWGPELVQIYNDRWMQFLGTVKHPKALGGRARETWPEIWPTIGPMVESVMSREEATGEENDLTLFAQSTKARTYNTQTGKPTSGWNLRSGSLDLERKRHRGASGKLSASTNTY